MIVGLLKGLRQASLIHVQQVAQAVAISSSPAVAHFTSTSSSPTAKHPLPEGVIVLPMPSLSHAMTSGKISRWLKQEGEQCQMYDIVLEVETESLVEEAYRVDDFAGKVILLIEANEEGWMAKQLLQQGQDVPVGQPIAVLCEEQDQMQQAAQLGSTVAQIRNVYEEDQSGRHIRTMVWQSYLKESSKGTNSGCGCM